MENFKECIRNHYLVAFFVTLTIAAGLLITSFFLPPTGKVDPSAMQATALIFAWPALAFATKALDDNKKVKISTKIGEITVGRKAGEETDTDVEMTMEEPNDEA